jgi:hypothetical protein
MEELYNQLARSLYDRTPHRKGAGSRVVPNFFRDITGTPIVNTRHCRRTSPIGFMVGQSAYIPK